MITTRKQNSISIGIHLAQFLSLVSTYDPDKYRLRFLVISDADQETECICTNYTYTAYQISQHFAGKTWEAMRNTHFSVRVGGNSHGLLSVFEFAPSAEPLPTWFVPKMEEWQGCRNGEAPSAVKASYLADRAKKDPKFVAANKCRAIVREGIRLKLDLTDYYKYFGCSRLAFRRHFERQFNATNGFTWDNYGSEWVVDHITPLSRFDLTDRDEKKAANRISNLQALTPEENRAKYNT